MRRVDWFGLIILVFWQDCDGLLIPSHGALLLLYSSVLTPHANEPFAILGPRLSYASTYSCRSSGVLRIASMNV